MPVTPTYPGVYIEEVRSGVRTITGVPTSITAFVGPALRGPTDAPRRITSWSDFQRIYGGLSRTSLMSYAVLHYYQNGGSEAVIVRVANGATPATIALPGGVALAAKYPGAWGNRLRARVDHITRPLEPGETGALYNLTIRDMGSGVEERFVNISTNTAAPRSLDNVLKQSDFVRATGGQDQRPTAHAASTRGEDPFADPADPPTKFTPATADSGAEGAAVTDAQYVDPNDDTGGIYLLRQTDIFNLLVIPPISAETDLDPATLAQAAALCSEQRAMLITDAPNTWTSVAAAINGRDTFVGAFGANGRNAALYFPRVRLADPLQENGLVDFPAAGVIAGVYARTDGQRGVWKAPAGTDATLNGVRELTVKVNDPENGQLNPLAVNCLRNFPVIGPVIWGARTLRGADVLADDDYKYVPVRRLTLYIEESLYRGLQWVVFEPNDEPLWAQIRLNAGAFMNTLFRQGAFQGSTPRDAYFVKCDKETTTQADINRGVVNVIVGFAPLKPAEFVIVKIQQMAGQVQA